MKYVKWHQQYRFVHILLTTTTKTAFYLRHLVKGTSFKKLSKLCLMFLDSVLLWFVIPMESHQDQSRWCLNLGSLCFVEPLPSGSPGTHTHLAKVNIRSFGVSIWNPSKTLKNSRLLYCGLLYLCLPGSDSSAKATMCCPLISSS